MTYRLLIITMLICMIVGSAAVAQEQSTPKSIWDVIFDNALSITIAFIFISAMIGAILKNLSIDKCLKHFDDFHVTLELTNQDLIWGTLKMYSTGLELFYREPRRDSSGHLESSYILYASQYDNIQTICRYHGDLSEKGRDKRENDIRNTYQPSIFTKAFRWLRNSVNTFNDAFSKSLNLIIGQMKKISPGSVILKHDSDLSKIGTEIIGYAGNAYDPILERYIGRKVVVEINYADKKAEYLGILKEYTPTFLELLNVHYTYTMGIPIKGKEVGKMEISGVDVQKQGEEYVLNNRSVTPLRVQAINQEGETSPLNIEIGPGQSAVVFRESYGVDDVTVTITTTRVVDIIAPRAKALIRHAGPPETLSWRELLGFDNVEYFIGRFRKSPQNPPDAP